MKMFSHALPGGTPGAEWVRAVKMIFVPPKAQCGQL